MSRPFFLLLFLPALGCSSEPAAPAPPAGSVPFDPQHTIGSGVTPSFLGQATFDIKKVKRITDKWHFMLLAKDGFELAVRSFSYAPGSFTGWHRHPGPVFIQVVQGTVTFYEADDPNCTPIVVDAGESYLDLGEHAHIGRNETDQPAQDVTVLFGPPGIGPTDFRIDVTPAPGNCPF
jgi:quercetin dioxygenase-like cupin family protein